MAANDRLKRLIAQAEEIGFTTTQQNKHTLFTHSNGSTYKLLGLGDYRAEKNVLAKLERLAGQKVQRANSRKSRKAPKPSGYLETFSTEKGDWRTNRIEALVQTHRDLKIEFAILAMAPVTNGDLNKAAAVIRKISKIEETLEAIYAPFEQFDYIQFTDLVQ